MSRAKVLYLINNLGSGGAQRQLLELANGLDPTRFEPLVCTYDPTDFYGKSSRYADISRICVQKTFKFDLVLAKRIAQIIHTQKIDILHTYLMAPTAWGYLASILPAARHRAALICSERSDANDGPLHWKWIRRWIFPHFDRIICNSERAGRQLKTILPRKAPDIDVIPNGIDIDYWSTKPPADPAVESVFEKLPQAALTAVMVASFHPWKDHVTLIRAIRNLPQVRLVLAGKAIVPESAKLAHDTIREFGLSDRVTIIDAVPDVRTLYQHADVVVLSSRFEGFPNVVLEGMATGLPVVSTDVSDVRDWLSPGVNGFVVPVEDESAMTECLRSLAELPVTQRRQLGNAAQQLARRFSITAMVNLTQACYEGVLVARGRPISK